MKCDIGPKMLVLAVFAIFVVGTALSAHARQCSLANVAGTYGFTATGTLILEVGPVPLAAAGTITLHADGTLSGKEFRSGDWLHSRGGARRIDSKQTQGCSGATTEPPSYVILLGCSISSASH